MNALDLATGLLCLLSGLAVGLRQILLSPSLGSWPDAGPVVRAVMFGVMAAFTWRGLELVGFGLSLAVARSTPGALVAAALLGAYNVILAVNMVRQVLPPAVWDRIKRIQSLAFCSPRGGLALLALAGVKVVRPGDGPLGVVDATDAADRKTPAGPGRRRAGANLH